jgi:hypothetical protein
VAKQPKGPAEIEADRLERARAAYYRASRAAIAAEDAGKPDAKLDAIAERTLKKLRTVESGEPATKSAAQLECEIAKALARDYETRTGNKLEIRKENAKWWIYSWTPGDSPEMAGPFRSERVACKVIAEMARARWRQ